MLQAQKLRHRRTSTTTLSLSSDTTPPPATTIMRQSRRTATSKLRQGRPSWARTPTPTTATHRTAMRQQGTLPRRRLRTVLLALLRRRTSISTRLIIT